MNLGDFQSSDNETVDTSIIKRVFLETHHQPGANLENSDQNVQLIFREKKQLSSN